MQTETFELARLRDKTSKRIEKAKRTEYENNCVHEDKAREDRRHEIYRKDSRIRSIKNRPVTGETAKQTAKQKIKDANDDFHRRVREIKKTEISAKDREARRKKERIAIIQRDFVTERLSIRIHRLEQRMNEDVPK